MLSVWNFARQMYQLFKYSQVKKWKCKQVYNTHFDFDTKVTVRKFSSHFTIVLLHGVPP